MFQVALGEQRRIIAYLDGLQARVDELSALQVATQAELNETTHVAAPRKIGLE